MISNEKQAIFIHIPKTAGTSIESALRKHTFKPQYNSYFNGKTATRGWDKKYDEVELIRGNTEFWTHKHRPAYLVKDEFQKYFKFAFVRNPWDLMVSSYHWWTQKNEDASEIRKQTSFKLRKRGFEYFVKSKFAHCINECFHDQEGQQRWINDLKQNSIIDFVGKFENLQSDFNKVCEKLELPKIKLPHELKTNRKPYWEYYTKETKEIIENIYRSDIERYGYEWEGKKLTKRRRRRPRTEHRFTTNSKEISLISRALDCKTLICINCCEVDRDHLRVLKNSDFYNRILNDDDIKVIEYYRGSDKIRFGGKELHFPGEEKYDKLHEKTYQLIEFCAKYFNFYNLVKLDGNFLSYTSVGERTRGKICGLDRVEKVIYKKPNVQYYGTNGRMFYRRDFHAWMKQKGLATDMDDPDWMYEELWYFCGKCYRINYDVAKFIANSEVCKKIVKQHDIENSYGMRPYSIEDVMIGRMYEQYLKQ